MSNDMKPRIRFKGFTNAWEQRKLNECATFRRGSFPQPYGKDEWYDGIGAMPFVQVADVSNSMKLVAKTKQMISKIAQPMSVFIPKESVIVTLQGTIGRVAITQYDAYLDRTVLYFDSYKKNIDEHFWAYIIKNKFLVEAKSAPGGTIKTITKEVLSNFDLKLPQNIKEQNKIGQFLNEIDNLITLHQRKYEKLVNIKKSLLEKMFPKNNSNIPEIRFKGFTDAWEQRKFGKIFDYERPDKYIVESDEYVEIGKTPVLTANKAFILGYTLENNSYKKEKESIVFDDFTLDTKFVDFPYMVKSSAIKILTLKNKVTDNLRFNYELLSNTKFNMLGHARHYISVVQPEEVYTTKKEEQDKIANIFANIDNLITLHQRKHDKLVKIKQSLLKDMFV